MSENKPKILFLDDEENILKALKRLFVDEPFEVYTASSGEEGLSVLKDNPDMGVIVSDQRMPGMSGWEFLEQSKQVAPDTTKIILTGHADINAAVNAINKGGAYRYIAKPWNDDDLIATVRDAYERYRLIIENRRLTALTFKQNKELVKWNTQLNEMVQEQTIDIQNKNKELERLNEQLKKNFRNSIEAFAALIEMREKSISSHSRNVALLAREIAVSMSLSDAEQSDITVASLLHDIGKIGVSDSVLMKSERQMNESETNEYKTHVVRGQVAVESMEGFADIGLIIRHHHENVDGSGYPDSLRKNSIPIGSRIIAIADSVDKLVNTTLQSADTYRNALREIEARLDTRYDRHIYSHMLPIINKRIKILEKQGRDKIHETEIYPARLEPGMVLARDVQSGTGVLVLAKGATLDEKLVFALQRYYRMDPPKTGVFVVSTEAGGN